MTAITPNGKPVPQRVYDLIPDQIYVRLAGEQKEDFGYSLLREYFNRIGEYVPFDQVWAVAQEFAYED